MCKPCRSKTFGVIWDDVGSLKTYLRLFFVGKDLLMGLASALCFSGCIG